MNKRKQTMIYSWLLPANVVDTIFGVAGLSDNSFRKAGKESARAEQQPCCAAAFVFFSPRCGGSLALLLCAWLPFDRASPCLYIGCHAVRYKPVYNNLCSNHTYLSLTTRHADGRLDIQ
jgi:hypothetical protein